MTRLIELINDRVSRYLAKSDVVNATPAIVQSVEDDNWATVQILSNDSVYRLRNLSGANIEVGDSCQVYYKKTLTQTNSYIGAAQPKVQSGSMQIISFETTNRLGSKSGEKYKIAEVSFVCHSLDKCYFSFSSSIKGTNNNDITLYLYIDNVETELTFAQSLTADSTENISFYLPVEISATGKHTITIRGTGQCNVLNIISYVYGFNLTEPESRLPDEYQEAEYLESTGTQYIDPDLLFHNDDISKCEITFAYRELINDTWACGIFNPFYGYVRGTAPIDGQWYTASGTVYDPNIFSVDTIISAQFNYNNSYGRLLFFCRYDSMNGVPASFSKSRIYGAKITRYDETILEFVPAIRKSDGKPGMYDIARERFFVNAGTGEFLIP